MHCSPGVRAELPARIPPGNMAMLVEASCVVSGHPVVGQAAGTDTISHLGILCAATAASCNANDAHVSGSTARQHNSGGGPLHVARVQLTHRQHRPEVAPAHLLTVRKRHTTDPFPAARAVNRGCCAYDWALPVSSSRQASSGGSATQRPHKLAGVPAAAAGAGAGGGLQAVGVDLGGEHSAVGGRHVPIVRGAAWQPVAAISDLMHCCLPQSMGQAMQVMG